MSKTAWIVVIAIIVVAVAALLFFVWRGMERRRRMAAMGPDERELYEAQKQYEAALHLAQETLERAEETWSRRVKKAEEAVSEARRIGSRPLGSFQKLSLYEDHIETPEGAFRFENGPVEAVVDSARNLASARESALSRAGREVLQELVSRGSGPEGMRALYLLVETPIFVTVTEVKPDDEVKARQFLHGVNGAAGSVPSITQTREQAVAQAQADLDATEAERDASGDAAIGIGGRAGRSTTHRELTVYSAGPANRSTSRHISPRTRPSLRRCSSATENRKGEYRSRWRRYRGSYESRSPPAATRTSCSLARPTSSSSGREPSATYGENCCRTRAPKFRVRSVSVSSV
jgi:hypothetical protein